MTQILSTYHLPIQVYHLSSTPNSYSTSISPSLFSNLNVSISTYLMTYFTIQALYLMMYNQLFYLHTPPLPFSTLPLSPLVAPLISLIIHVSILMIYPSLLNYSQIRHPHLLLISHTSSSNELSYNTHLHSPMFYSTRHLPLPNL